MHCLQTAIDKIDKSIDHLRKTKDTLLYTHRDLRLAKDKLQEVTIKKLTGATRRWRASFPS